MKKILPIVLALSIFVLNSCKKSTDFIDNIAEKSPAVGFGLNNGSAITLDIVPGVSPTADTTIKVYLSSASSGSASIAVDNSVVDSYNASHGTAFDYAPTDSYTIPTTVTFSGGSNAADATLSIDLNKLLASGTQFALGLTLSSSGSPTVLSGNNKIVVLINVRNKYDGVYKVTGTMVDQAAASITGFYPEQVELITTSANSVDWYSLDFDDYYHGIYSGSNVSVYGAFSPQFTFDANDKITSVTNYYGQPDPSRGRSAKLDPSGINAYDPATKTIKVKYILNQTGIGDRTFFDETFTYVGPR